MFDLGTRDLGACDLGARDLGASSAVAPASSPLSLFVPWLPMHPPQCLPDRRLWSARNQTLFGGGGHAFCSAWTPPALIARIAALAPAHAICLFVFSFAAVPVWPPMLS